MLAMSINDWLDNPKFIDWKKTLGDTRGVSSDQLLFCWACSSGQADLVGTLLSLKATQAVKFQANFNSDYALQQAAKHGHLSVMKILCELPECNPRTNFGFCLIVAAENGNLEMVELLANMKRADSTGADSYIFEAGDFVAPLSTAARKGQSPIVKFFCDYTRPKADGSNQEAYVCRIDAKDNEAIKDAAMHNQQLTTEILAQAYKQRSLLIPQYDKIDALLSDAKLDKTVNFSWQGYQNKSTQISKEDETTTHRKTSALKSSK